VEWFNTTEGWQAGREEGDVLSLLKDGQLQGKGTFEMAGAHNRANAVAALLAARHVGVTFTHGLEALARFKGVKRRLEVRGTVRGVTVYDDFAHHPTAIEATISGLRGRVGTKRIIAVLEPRSNTMKLGTMKAQLPASLTEADRVFCYANNLGWDAAEVLAPLGDKTVTSDSLEVLVREIAAEAREGDQILVMSNGGFGGIHGKLLQALAR
jgi:UDP-N-acetylmuramate: L-alanyl-gamma-D-glutamyl-meso-diaminopimelate ligase